MSLGERVWEIVRNYAAAATLISALFIYTGYVSLAMYLGNFLVDVSSLDVPTVYVAVYGAIIIDTFAWGLFIVLLLVWLLSSTAAFVIRERFPIRYASMKEKMGATGSRIRLVYLRHPGWIVTFALFGLFGGATVLAVRRGNLDAISGEKQPAFVHLAWRPTDKPRPEEELLKDANEHGRLCAVWLAKDFAILYTIDKSGTIHTFRVFMSDVFSISGQRRANSKAQPQAGKERQTS